PWYEETGYTVNYNRLSLLDITFTARGAGAYPDTFTRHLLLNLKTGDRLRAADVFTSSGRKRLTGMVNAALQAEVQNVLKSEAGKEEGIREQLAGAAFPEKQLDDYVVSDRGLTFLHDFAFPHVIEAAEPPGAYFFPYAALKAWIKPDGPLG